MEIHKPKPWHNWREFLKELGTIALGVGVALAAEQTVESWHEHREYLEARSAVRDELNANLANLRRRDGVAGCIAARLKQIATVLEKADKGEAFDPMPPFAGPTTYYVDNFAFQAASQAGRASLFPPEELRAYGRIYVRLQHLVEVQEKQRETWYHLQPLIGRSRFTPETALSFSMASAEANGTNGTVARQIVLLTKEGEALGIKGDGEVYGSYAGVPANPLLCGSAPALSPGAHAP